MTGREAGPEPASRILVVDDEQQVARICAHFLQKEGWEVDCVYGAEEALARLRHGGPYGIVFLDLKMPHSDGRHVLTEVRRSSPGVEVVMVTANASTEMAVECMKLGACEYVTKPFKRERVTAAALHAEQVRALRGQVHRLRSEARGGDRYPNLVGRSPAMLEVFEWIARAAPGDSPVVILGPSGTGKDVVARTIHAESARRTGPFIAINCAALPAELIESELFGHARGAFTGAVSDSVGIFRAAEGGTVFLDEVVEMPLGAQAKLLRALQDRRVRPVGSTEEVAVDVRVVAATNRDLDEAVRQKQFRDDLFYRLSVITFRLPPLSERDGDVPLLVEHIIERLNRRGPRQITEVAPEAMEALARHRWAGNVRELENQIERCFVVCRGSVIRLADLPQELRRAGRGTGDGAPVRTLAEAEKEEVQRALERTGGNISAAARQLGITRKRLYRIGRAHGLDV